MSNMIRLYDVDGHEGAIDLIQKTYVGRVRITRAELVEFAKTNSLVQELLDEAIDEDYDYISLL